MFRQTRREFLEESLFAAAAAAMAGTSAIGQSQAQEQSTSPNERLRIAILGGSALPGSRGNVHIDEWSKRKDCEIVTICDPDEAAGQRGVARVEKNGGKATFVRDLRKVFDDKSINIVSIATPNHWHALAAIWAIQAGKDVYVEKPVSHNVTEGRRIVDAARNHKRICQAGTQSRSGAGTRDLIAFLRDGGIGDVKLARGICHRDRTSIGPRGEYDVPATVDLNLWCGPAPMGKLTRPRFHYDWHWQWDYGNGDIGNQGIHQMDLARWGLGASGLAQSVLSYGGRVGYEDAGETANTQVAMYDYGDRTLVFEVRGLPKKKDVKGVTNAGVVYYGTKGYAVHGGRDLTDRRSPETIVAFDLDGKPIRTFANRERELVANHVENFLKAVRSRNVSDQNADIEEGHLSSALCHLGNVSYRLGEMMPVSEVQKRLEHARLKDECLETLERVKVYLSDNKLSPDSTQFRYGTLLKVDGKSEKFIGPDSKMANPLLTREYRKGFEVPSSAQLA
jgi:predicted dehydrogenase